MSHILTYFKWPFLFTKLGAFYFVLALSVIMYAQSLWHIPELITGLIGAVLIRQHELSSRRTTNSPIKRKPYV